MLWEWNIEFNKGPVHWKIKVTAFSHTKFPVSSSSTISPILLSNNHSSISSQLTYYIHQIQIDPRNIMKNFFFLLAELAGNEANTFESMPATNHGSFIPFDRQVKRVISTRHVLFPIPSFVTFVEASCLHCALSSTSIHDSNARLYALTSCIV